MEQWDHQQSNFPSAPHGVFYDQLSAQFRRQYTQQAHWNLAYPAVQLTHPNFGHDHSNRNPTTNTSPPLATPMASASRPTKIPDELSHSANRSENGGGFFSFSIGSGPLPYGRACTHCKKAKIKCVFEFGASERCNQLTKCAVAVARADTSAPSGNGNRGAQTVFVRLVCRLPQYLQEQIRQKDRIIRSLLKQLQNRYSSPPSMGNSLSNGTHRGIPSDLQTSVHYTGDVLFQDSPDKSKAGEEGEKAEEASMLPDASAPLGLIANWSLSSSRRGRSDTRESDSNDLDDDDIGVANAAYFEPGPATNLRMRARLLEHSAPEIVLHGVVNPEDVDNLFKIFHTNLNPFIPLLDPVLHTPTTTFTRCPILFTVVCAIASRYYTERSEIYPIAMQFAKRSAANALNDGWKTIELCQAYILLSIYSVPMQKSEKDCSWLYSGVAIRLATDLNLHQNPISYAPQANEKQERELLNRTRVWMTCFNLDCFAATQSGKPMTIKPDFAMKCRSDDWYRLSPYNSVYDLCLCATTGLLIFLADFHDQIFSEVTGILGSNKHIDFRSATLGHDTKLAAFSHKWANRFVQQSNSTGASFIDCTVPTFYVVPSPPIRGPSCSRSLWNMLIEPGSSLRTLSCSPRHSCLESAKTVLGSMIEGLGSTGFRRYCPDGHFIIVIFASAVLLKLLGPEFSCFMPAYEETQVYHLIREVIQTLSSAAIAVDERHTPKLYAHFLDGLLSRRYWDRPVHGHLSHQRTILESSVGQWSSNYEDNSHASSISTMSSAWGDVAAYSHQETDKPHVYQLETVPISIHRPDAMHSGPIRHNTETNLPRKKIPAHNTFQNVILSPSPAPYCSLAAE
ncbi:Protein priB [Mycena sanguinolenta]|uniref:Protein priB n=1 Tax=Mycena sanguinolenta TaxID=230812 RepID=A0A8H7DF05_9AGAR|nr:Protein priB [Mycena sanguinolenta]